MDMTISTTSTERSMIKRTTIAAILATSITMTQAPVSHAQDVSDLLVGSVKASINQSSEGSSESPVASAESSIGDIADGAPTAIEGSGDLLSSRPITTSIIGSVDAADQLTGSSASNPKRTFTNWLLDYQRSVTQNVQLNDGLLKFFLGFFRILGSLRAIIIEAMGTSHVPTPGAINPAITDLGITSRTPLAEGREVWKVKSPSMGRTVNVTVSLPKDPSTPAPAVYLYGGVNAAADHPWVTRGDADIAFGNDNVALIYPRVTEASMYVDWESDDPNLGRNKWETFITEELAPVVEAEFNHNGKRAALGLSMGAGGVVFNAVKNPGFFQGIGAISGCYSTTDAVGRSTLDLTVGTRHGDVNNMFGPDGSAAWAEHDAVVNAANFAGTAIYLFAGRGTIPEDGYPTYDKSGPLSQFNGTLLENGSYQCTKAFSEALTKNGIAHTVEYKDEAAHGWFTFGPQLTPAWAAIRSAVL